MNKPTVGILSMQRVINYGSFLQAYGLQQLLKKNGAGETYFIDIKPGKNLVESTLAQPKLKRVLNILLKGIKNKSLLHDIRVYRFNKRLKESIMSSWDILGLNKSIPAQLDAVVIGSDEVFNCTQDSWWGYSTQLFGDIPAEEAKKVFSYAGSFGYTKLEDLKKYGVDKEISWYLQNLSGISVRDENSKKIVETLTGTFAQIHIDPVLAYGYKKEVAEMHSAPIRDKYMIVYSYQDRIKEKYEVDAIVRYARDNNMRLISIFCRYDWCDQYVLPATPIDVLRWFKFAECIATDTFHGTIFSIITHSRFASFLRQGNKNKLQFLLESIGLEQHMVEDSSSLERILSKTPDYSECESRLTEFRKSTDDYLRELLNG